MLLVCQGASTEYPQHMFSWRNKNNVMWIGLLSEAMICVRVQITASDKRCIHVHAMHIHGPRHLSNTGYLGMKDMYMHA